MKQSKWITDLLAWYASARREMPWRGHPDPYAVWVSEIMLQQTQVETVRGYFVRFLAAFPTLESLACAQTDALLKAWEGLGYYTRARNLRKAAQLVVAEKGGEIPRSATELVRLPGIGDYTAAAIASICFAEPAPVVDGNVARVFARYRGLSDDFKKPAPRLALAAWLKPAIESCAVPGDFNQAMMELGALICTPRNPACGECPLAPGCFARKHAAQADYPFKAAKKESPLRFAVACVIRSAGGKWLFMRRPGEKLLGGLWELPGGSCEKRPDANEALALIQQETGLPIAALEARGRLVHVFSHFKLELSLFSASPLAETTVLPDHFRWVDSPDELPLATAHRKLLKKV